MSDRRREDLIRLLYEPSHSSQGIELARSLGMAEVVLEVLESAEFHRHRDLLTAAVAGFPAEIAAEITRLKEAGWLCQALPDSALRRDALSRLLVSPRIRKFQVTHRLHAIPELVAVLQEIVHRQPLAAWRDLRSRPRLVRHIPTGDILRCLSAHLDEEAAGGELLELLRGRTVDLTGLASLLRLPGSRWVHRQIVAFLVACRPLPLEAQQATRGFLRGEPDDAPLLLDHLGALMARCEPTQRQALSGDLIHRILYSRSVKQKRRFAALMAAPLPPLPIGALIAEHDEPTACALIIGLGCAMDATHEPLLRTLASGPPQRSLTAEAAESLGMLWQSAPPEEQPVPAPPGLTMALAMAGQYAHYRHLSQQAQHDPDAALMLVRLHRCCALSAENLARSLCHPGSPRQLYLPSVIARRARRSTNLVRPRWLHRGELHGRAQARPIFDTTRADLDALGDALLPRLRSLLSQRRSQEEELLRCIGHRPDLLLDLSEDTPPDSSRFGHIALLLERCPAAGIGAALRARPARMRFRAVLPSALSPAMAAILLEMLDEPRLRKGAWALLMEKSPPPGGMPVPLAMLLDPGRLPVTLRIVLGEGSIDPEEVGWRAALLCELAEAGGAVHHRALSRSKGWLLVLLSLPTLLPPLVRRNPGALMLLAPHAAHPHARAAIALLAEAHGARLLPMLPHAWEASGRCEALIAALSACWGAMSPAQRRESLSRLEGWRGAPPPTPDP